VVAHALTDPPSIDQVPLDGDDTQPLSVNSLQPTIVDASVAHVLPAYWTDPRMCASDPPPLFHWVVTDPTRNVYTSQGIAGYHDNPLTIEDNSLPAYPRPVFGIGLTVTSQVPSAGGEFLTSFRQFWILNQGSQVSVFMSTSCQATQVVNNMCIFAGALEVLPGTDI
jgi:hypothetical protein